MRNLLPHFIAEQFQQERFEGAFSAVTLFVDISGFTPMTEALMVHGSEGAEALSQILNIVFDPLVDIVYDHGGFISNFSGDAFTAMFPGNVAPGQLLQAADRVRAGFNRRGRQHTKYGDFDLAVRTGISVGEVEWGIVGSSGKAFYFRGEAIDSCAAGKRRAQPGEIIIDESVRRLLRPGLVELESIGEASYRLVRVAQSVGEPALKPLRRPQLSKKVALQFYPEEVVEFHRAGEFREVASVFVWFDGISTRVEMENFALLVIERAGEFSGYVKEIEFTEGGVVPVFFGAPVAFENNIERALDFILALQGDIAAHPGLSTLRTRAGISYGRVFAGMLGGSQRSQYALVGSMVNLAARLAARASWGEIHVTEKIARHPGFDFEDRGEISYKGIPRAVRTYLLTGESPSISEHFFAEDMVGHTVELRMLARSAEPIFEGRFAGVAYIFGDPGIGKSQLAHTFRRQMVREHDVSWFICQADQILRRPFNPIVCFLRGYFGLSADASVEENNAAFQGMLGALIQEIKVRSDEGHISDVEEIVEELERTRSIFGALLGLVRESSPHEELDGKGRYEKMLFALKNLILAESLLHPVVLQIEDGQWLDADSAAFLRLLVRNITSYPILLLVTSRYGDDGALPRLDLEEIPEVTLRVNNLSADELTKLATAELGGRPGRRLRDVLLEKTAGNPFFIQQMILYFREHDLLETRDDEWRLKPEALEQTTVPETVSAMLIARIDRLSGRVRDVVMAAAVIGQEFEVLLLSSVLHNDVTGELKQGEQHRVWGMVDELRYIFKHALLRDAAYQMQLWGRLRELHRLTAEAMEKLYADNLAAHSLEIAHHYEKAEVADRAIEYLRRAGDHARDQYQNQVALEIYDRLGAYLQGNDAMRRLWVDTLLKKGDVLELIGTWGDAEEQYREARRVAELEGDLHATATAERLLGRILKLQGNYQEAMSCLRHALSISEELGDQRNVAHVTGIIGNLFFVQGEYLGAMEYYLRQLSICEGLGDTVGIAGALSNMGSVYFNQGDYSNALSAYQRYLSISEERRDRLGIARGLGNLGVIHHMQGEYGEALELHRSRLSICEELGDRRGIAFTTGDIGTVHFLTGDYAAAMESYRRKLLICEELGDRHGIAQATGNMGNVYFTQGAHSSAMESYRRNEQISRELGDRHGIAQAAGNMGNVYFTQGRYGDALELYSTQLLIAEELGDRLACAIATGNIGCVCQRQKEYRRALDRYEVAVAISRDLGASYYLALFLSGKVSLLLDLIDSHEEMPEYLSASITTSTAGWRADSLQAAQTAAEESVAISGVLEMNETYFAGRVLLARIAVALGDRVGGVESLRSMLTATEGEEGVWHDDDKRAELHYWLWKLGESGSEEREAALALYTRLSRSNANPEYLLRIGELSELVSVT